MADITWILTNESSKPVVRLTHAYFGGKRKVWVNNVLVIQEQKLIDNGSRHFIQIGDKEYEIAIITNGITYSYYLLQDGFPILSENDKKKGKSPEDLLKSGYFRDSAFWCDMGKSLNLKYLPDYKAAWAYRHRLVGSLSGYLILIRKGFLPITNRECWMVLIRHAAPLSSEVGDRIRADSRISPLLGNLKNSNVVFEQKGDLTWFYLPYLKKETSAELAEVIQIFIKVVSEHIRPLPEGICQNPNCRQHIVQERRLVLINDIPNALCQDCIDAVPGWGEKTKGAYQQAPNHLLPGFFAGVGAAFLGALVWATLAIVLDMVISVMSVITLGLTVKAMDKVHTKRTGFSLVMATLLTLFSILLGNWATLFLTLLRLGYPFSIRTVFTSWQELLAKPSLLFLTSFITLLLAGYLGFMWFQQKAQLQLAFSPQVEVVPE